MTRLVVVEITLPAPSSPLSGQAMEYRRTLCGLPRSSTPGASTPNAWADEAAPLQRRAADVDGGVADEAGGLALEARIVGDDMPGDGFLDGSQPKRDGGQGGGIRVGVL